MAKIRVPKEFATHVAAIGHDLELSDDGDQAEGMVRRLAFQMGISLFRQNGGWWTEERIFGVVMDELRKGIEDEKSVQETGNPSEHEKRFAGEESVDGDSAVLEKFKRDHPDLLMVMDAHMAAKKSGIN